MRAYVPLVTVITLMFGSAADAQLTRRPDRPGHKLRVKIDSQPQQAAIYIDSKEFGIEGYTPTTLKLPKGTYTIILELPGWKPISRPIQVTRSEGFIFTMERQARPAVLEVRSTSGDSASGGQLLVDGAVMGSIPGRVELAEGQHVVEVKKPGFRDYREQVTVKEGETRTMVIELAAEAKKGSILVVADAGADIFIDGVRKDAAPAVINDLSEGSHTVEVRKDPLPPWKQVVQVIGGQQVKVEAKLGTGGGSLRVVSSTPNAEVVVDGEPKGPVNSEIKDLRPGQHIVEVRAQGFAPQTVEVTVATGEQRVARVDLQPAAVVPRYAMLRVVTPVPEAEVFIDGASVGKAPIERPDLAPGKHFVVVRAQGYAEWKREVDLDPAQPTVLTAELSRSGTVKVLANIPNAEVLLDGLLVGKSPATLEKVPAGDHLLEVRFPGYVPAKQAIHVEGGEEKVLSANLLEMRKGLPLEELRKISRSQSSYSAVTLEPGKFTADIAGGYIPFAEVRLTVGAWRKKVSSVIDLGLDAGVGVRTFGYLTDAGAHAKFQFLHAGPAAIGLDLFIGGGGGPTDRTTFMFELGLPVSLLFGELVRFTVKPYLQVYSDRNCPSVGDIQQETGISGPLTEAQAAKSKLYMNEQSSCKVRDGRMARLGDPLPISTTATGGVDVGQDPRDRFVGGRFMLQAALEIAVHQVASIFFIFEGDPVGQRQALTAKFSSVLPTVDAQVYGRAGVTFKF